MPSVARARARAASDEPSRTWARAAARSDAPTTRNFGATSWPPMGIDGADGALRICPSAVTTSRFGEASPTTTSTRSPFESPSSHWKRIGASASATPATTSRTVVIRNVRVRARDMNSRRATARMFGMVRAAYPPPGLEVVVMSRLPREWRERAARLMRLLPTHPRRGSRGGGRPRAGGRPAR